MLSLLHSYHTNSGLFMFLSNSDANQKREGNSAFGGAWVHISVVLGFSTGVQRKREIPKTFRIYAREQTSTAATGTREGVITRDRQRQRQRKTIKDIQAIR